jgi:AraC-like DNA-binding protein
MRLATFPAPTDGSLPLWPPLLATRGRGTKSARHAHHALHVVLATEGELRVTIGDRPTTRACGIVTAPDVAHALDASETEVLLVFLDPESQAGASILPTLGGDSRALSPEQRDALLEGATPRDIMLSSFGDEWTRRAVNVLGGEALGAKPQLHPRVKKLLALLRTQSPHHDASLESLAASIGLSSGRLMHAFTDSVGIPLRPYLQWLKLQRAAGAIVSGAPLSEAAHAAGFADAAHMSRTFRRMLGTTPSELRNAVNYP